MFGTLPPLAVLVSLFLGAVGVAMWTIVRCRGGSWWRSALLVASIGVVGATALVFRGHEEAPAVATATGPARMVPVPGTWALTDSGSVVPVGVPLDPQPDHDIPEGFESRVIAVGSAESTSNCHGWVFVEGRYWIPTESVDTILVDNSYVQVDDPGLGDLVVYRDPRGRPLHTGVVKAVGIDDFVLVESKWGQSGVFWHTPFDQAFGDRVEYWRAGRDGHSLRMNRRSGATATP